LRIFEQLDHPAAADVRGKLANRTLPTRTA
jgi:hypothetical protein